jgi:hypothetical protein
MRPYDDLTVYLGMLVQAHAPPGTTFLLVVVPPGASVFSTYGTPGTHRAVHDMLARYYAADDARRSWN